MEGMRGKWVAAPLALALLAGAGALVWRYAKRPVEKPAAAVPAPPPAGAEIRLDGTIQAVNLVLVGAPIDGVVEEFPVKPGDEVYEGQLLGHISNDSLKEHERDTAQEVERAQNRVSGLESELIGLRLEDSRVAANAARARMERSRAESLFERQKMLNREGATPRRAFEKAQADYEATAQEAAAVEALQASVRDRVERLVADIEAARKALADKEKSHDEAKADLSAADILAPADGLILSIRRVAGEDVDRGMTDLIQMATDLSQLELVVQPEPQLVKRITVGDAARVLLPELPGDGLPGTVKSAEGGRVVLEFSSPSTLIRPGMTATGVLRLN